MMFRGGIEMPKRGVLHHIEINVSDLKRSKAFYGWLMDELGYRTFQEWPEGISWKLESTYLVLVQTDERFLQPDFHRKRSGLNHLAFHAESRDDVDHLTDKLRKRGVPILYDDRHPFAGGPGYYAVFFEDPDRLKLEFAAPN
jgi:catechol 2,3-dioxygenase-like lactoylglutathione lyase family enzyme